MKEHILHATRNSLKEWVDQASMGELMHLFSTIKLFEKPEKTPKATLVIQPKKIISPKPLKKRRISPSEGEKIREIMAGLRSNTPEYREKRKAICLEMGVTERQVGSCTWPRRKNGHVIPFSSAG